MLGGSLNFCMLGRLFISWCVQLRHVLQEVLIVREYHVVQGMVVAHEDAGVIVGFLEGDRIAVKCHLAFGVSTAG